MSNAARQAFALQFPATNPANPATDSTLPQITNNGRHSAFVSASPTAGSFSGRAIPDCNATIIGNHPADPLTHPIYYIINKLFLAHEHNVRAEDCKRNGRKIAADLQLMSARNCRMAAEVGYILLTECPKCARL